MDDLRSLSRKSSTAAGRIRDLERRLIVLSVAVQALNGRIQRTATTIGPLSIGTTDVDITWPSAWPDTGYYVAVELITGAAQLGNLHATLKVGSRTSTGCTVTVSTSAAVASVGVDVVGIRT